MTALPIARIEEQPEQLQILVYGAPGVGKTVLSATAEDDPRSAPALYVNVERGEMSIAHRTGLAVYNFTDYEANMGELLGTIRAEVAAGTWEFKTVIVDSLTQLTDLGMKAVLATDMKRAVEGNPEYADWNTWTNRMLAMISSLQKLPFHLIMTALEETEGNVTGPMFKGKKIAPYVMRMFNTVGRLSVVSEADPNKPFVNSLLLRQTPRYHAKDRSNKMSQLSPVVERPTVAKLLDRIEEGKRLASSLAR